MARKRKPSQSVEKIKKRFDAAWSRKENWRDLYEQCYEYALPQRNLYDGSWSGNTPGRNKGGRVFDSTAVHGVQRFANRIQSGLFPPDKHWMALQPGPDIGEEDKANVHQGCQELTDRFFTILRQTNFDLALGEMLMDLCVGTGVMLIQPGNAIRPINFRAIPQHHVALEEGPNGVVENVYRKIKMPVENITREWPDAKLPEKLKTLLEDKPQEMVELQESTIVNQRDGGFDYYICHKDGEGSSEMMVYRYIVSSPWVVSRYSKVSGEIFGRGPVVSCLHDILSLNKTVELLLKNASLNISGVYTAVDDGVLNPQTIRIIPGAVVPVARNGGPQGPSLQPLPRAGDLQLTQIVLQDLRMNIKRTLLDDSLPPDNMSARSATEIVERMRELATNLGSAFGRLISETMVPVVLRSMTVMEEAGIIPKIPLLINGQEIKVVPVSPLAQAQNMDDVQDVMQWMGIATQMGPAGLQTVNMEAIADWVADRLGVPMPLRTTPEERAEMEQQAQAMMQQQMQVGAQEQQMAAEQQAAVEEQPV